MTISASKPSATAPASNHAVASGALASCAWPIRLTIAAPAATIESVIGKWLSTQFVSAGPFLGNRRPTRSK